MLMSQPSPIKHFYKGLYDGPHATPKFVEDGPIFLGVKNLTEDGQLDLSDVNCISEQDFQKWTRRVCPQANDIVFVYEAGLHRYAIIPDGFLGCLGRRIALIRPNTEKILPRFLLFYFLSNEWKSVINSKIFSGATVDRIPLIDFPEFEVSIPSLQAQKQISAVLSAYDDLIENNKRRIALLEKMAEEIYREWFVRMRFPGHEQVVFHKGIPEGWEMKNIEYACYVGDGAHASVKREPDGIPYLTTKNFKADGLNLSTVDYISIQEYKKYFGGETKTVKTPQKGDVLMGIIGSFGQPYLVDPEDFFGISSSVAILRPNPEKILSEYLYACTRSKGFIEYIHSTKSGSAQGFLSLKMIGCLPLLLPPLKLQKYFAEIRQPISLQIKLLKSQCRILSETRDRLLPRLISGKLAVEDLDIQFPPSMTNPSEFQPD
jgi:type I restriction enzyme, S subunit